MDPYELLRRQAADKRDLLIRSARDEYAATVAKINAIRVTMGHSEPLGLRSKNTVSQILRANLPQSTTFTVDELVDDCKAIHPGQRFRRDSVRAAMQRYKDQGLIKRVGKTAGGHYIWAATGLNVSQKRYDALPARAALEDVLADGRHRTSAELVVAVQALGYRADMPAANLHPTIRRSLHSCNKVFCQDGDGRWGLVSGA